MEQPYVLLILYRQYHTFSLSHQGTSRHGADHISGNIMSIALKELIIYPNTLRMLHWCQNNHKPVQNFYLSNFQNLAFFYLFVKKIDKYHVLMWYLCN